jgi:hypothetical protein
MLPIRDDHPIKHLFSGLVEHAFQTELGMCDPALADYVSDLLVAFVHMDEMSIARDAAGRPVGEIAEMIDKWSRARELPIVDRDRFLHRRIGDYTLFWSGVYPEGVGRCTETYWRDQMVEYIAFGKRSYAIASELTPPDDKPPARLLRRLSEEFESCVYGLGLVRQGLGETGSSGGGDNPHLIY